MASFRLLEQPIRNRTWRLPGPGSLVPALAGGLAGVRAAGHSPAAEPLALQLDRRASRVASSRGLPGEGGLPQVDAAAFTAPPTPPSVPRPVQIMVAGDSIARTLWQALLPGQAYYNLRLTQQTALGCGIARALPTEWTGTRCRSPASTAIGRPTVRRRGRPGRP